MSVCGTGDPGSAPEVFLAQGSKNPARHEASPSPCGAGTFNRQLFSHPHVSLMIIQSRCRNIKPASSIAYALRPRLRSRLTLGGRTFPRKPWVYGGRGFHPSYRYSCLHSHLLQLHRPFPDGFKVATMLPYQSNGSKSELFQSFGMTLIANHFRRRNTR